MVAQGKKGYNYEHTIKNDIYEYTDGELTPIRSGYSGNGKLPSADLVIDDGSYRHLIELKKTSKEKFTIENKEIKQLIELTKNYPTPNTHAKSCAYIGIKFNNRTLAIAELKWITSHQKMKQLFTEDMPIPCYFTEKNNLKLEKPTLSEWKSAQKGCDEKEVLKTINYL